MKNIIFITTLFALAVYADAPWQPNVRVSTQVPWDTLDQGESCFDVCGDSIFAVCNTAQRGTDPNDPFAYSLDHGKSFIQIPFVDEKAGSTWQTDPVITVDDSGHLHMLIQFSASFFNHYLSRDGGKTWCDTSRINSSTGVDKPWWVFDKNEIYVVWQQVNGATGIYFARSTNYGVSFSDTRIWDKTGICALAIDEKKVLHLAVGSFGGTLSYRKSTNKGATWSAEKQLGNQSTYETGYGDRAPINSITACKDVVFITWVDNSLNGSWEVNGIRSTNGGETFGQKFVVNDITAGGQCKGYAHFDCYGGLHFIYYHTPQWPVSQSSIYSVRYQYSKDGGATFSKSIRLTDAEWKSHAEFMGEYHVVRSDSQYIYAVWADGRNPDNNYLYFSKALLSDITAKMPDATAPASPRHLCMPSLCRGEAIITVSGCRKPFEIIAFDASGRIVKKLYAGKSTAPVRVKLKNTDVPAGILFIRLQSENISEVGRMTVMK